MAIVVRTPVVDDVKGMARVHVDSWRETYHDSMPHDVLYAPDFLETPQTFLSDVNGCGYR